MSKEKLKYCYVLLGPIIAIFLLKTVDFFYYICFESHFEKNDIQFFIIPLSIIFMLAIGGIVSDEKNEKNDTK